MTAGLRRHVLCEVFGTSCEAYGNSFSAVSIDLSVDPQTAALRVLARATAGTVTGFESQLDAVLGELPRRRRLWFTEPDVAADGQLHRIAVTLPRMKKEARAPEWLPSP